jgi:Homing endonuclease associated repeat
MTKTYTVITPERRKRVAEARRLRAQGLLQREIQEKMRLSRSAVSDLLTDPWREKAQARRARYGGTCQRCGAPTDGSAGPSTPPPTLCGKCALDEQHERRHWTKERILEAVHRYAEENGRQPSSQEWLGTAGKDRPPWAPPTPTVIREFGSWSACMNAAGFESYTGIKIRKGGTGIKMYHVFVEQSDGVWKDVGNFEGNKQQAVQAAFAEHPPVNGEPTRILLVHSHSFAPQTIRPVQKVVYEMVADA